MADDIIVSARVEYVSTGRIKQVNDAYLDQSGTGKASGEVNATTTATSFIFTGITTPGQTWFFNAGTNDISIGILVSAVFRPVLTVKPGIPAIMSLDAAVTATTVLQYKVASGTSLLEWECREA